MFLQKSKDPDTRYKLLIIPWYDLCPQTYLGRSSSKLRRTVSISTKYSASGVRISVVLSSMSHNFSAIHSFKSSFGSLTGMCILSSILPPSNALIAWHLSRIVLYCAIILSSLSSLSALYPSGWAMPYGIVRTKYVLEIVQRLTITLLSSQRQAGQASQVFGAL
jgi:hypothetical protein